MPEGVHFEKLINNNYFNDIKMIIVLISKIQNSSSTSSFNAVDDNDGKRFKQCEYL